MNTPVMLSDSDINPKSLPLKDVNKKSFKSKLKECCVSFKVPIMYTAFIICLPVILVIALLNALKMGF